MQIKDKWYDSAVAEIGKSLERFLRSHLRKTDRPPVDHMIQEFTRDKRTRKLMRKIWEDRNKTSHPHGDRDAVFDFESFQQVRCIAFELDERLAKVTGGADAGMREIMISPSLPYDMGNAGDLLKHGALATFVEWFLGLPEVERIRYADPFGGHPWEDLKENEIRNRLHKLSSALPVIQSAQPHRENKNRYYGSSHVVLNVAKASKAQAVVLASDEDELARSDLEASGIGLIEEAIETYDPGNGFGILSEQYDGRFDLILLDPFRRFLLNEFGRNRTQTGHFTSISRAVKRNSDLCVMLFVLDMTENYIHDSYLEEKEKLKDFSFSLRCPKLEDTGVRGEDGYNTEILLISKRFAERTTSIEELKRRLRNLGRTLETVLPEPGNRIEFWPPD